MSTEDPRTCDAATMTVDPTTVEACVSTEDPRSCDVATMTVDPTTVEACVSTEDPRSCDAATMTVDKTMVDACVSTEDPRSCDAATMTVDPTMVDACVSTEDHRTCDVATMTVDPTVMCVAETQTETGMDGGGAAAKEEYELQLAMKEKKIWELEEELSVSKGLLEYLMLNIKSVEQQVSKYAEKPVISWSDDCECKQQVSAVVDLLKNVIIMERDVNKLEPESTSDRNNKVDCGTQTETNSRRRDCANTDEQEGVRRLEDKNRQLSKLVEKYEAKIAVLNEEMEQILQDQTSHIDYITMRYEKENHRQQLKMRDMRDELLFYKKNGFPASVSQHGVMGKYSHYCFCL